MDELSNEELFNSALSNEQPEAVTEEPVAESGQHRDDQGRFATKGEDEPQPIVTQAKPVEQKEAAESPGVRQLREAFERSERRRAELEQQLISSRPKPEPAPRPDIFEKPDEFVRQGVQEAVDPVNARVNSVVEFYSKRDAVKQHGEEKVSEAFNALDRAAATGDPLAIATVQAVKRSMDPYGEIVSWHVKNEVGADPDAFFQRKLEERLQDEKFKGELLSKIAPAKEDPKPVIQIPPSLGRVASAASSLTEGGDLTNESLFAHAMR